jgi:hypothetical protein
MTPFFLIRTARVIPYARAIWSLSSVIVLCCVGAVQTPNVLSTPARGAGAAGGGGVSVLGTPIRDNLRINAAEERNALLDGSSTPADVRQAKKAAAKRQTAIQKQVKTGLLDLPAPQNEWTYLMPELPPKPELPASATELVEDAEDAVNRLAAEAKSKVDEEMRKRSQAVQRALPRPFAINFAMDAADTVRLLPSHSPHMHHMNARGITHVLCCFERCRLWMRR